MVDIIGRREHFTLVDIVDFDGLKDLCLCKMSDTALGHHGDADGFLNAFNHLGVAHTRNAARSTDVGRNTFQCHNCAGTCGFCNTCLFGSGDVHNDAALKHLRQLAVEGCSIFHYC